MKFSGAYKKSVYVYLLRFIRHPVYDFKVKDFFTLVLLIYQLFSNILQITLFISTPF